MIFGKRAIVKYIPKFMDNDKSEDPSSVDIKIISAAQQMEWAESVKDKNANDFDVFRLAFAGAHNIYDNEDSLSELTTADDIINCPGFLPLIQEIVREFNRLNFYGGERKNVQ